MITVGWNQEVNLVVWVRPHTILIIFDVTKKNRRETNISKAEESQRPWTSPEERDESVDTGRVLPAVNLTISNRCSPLQIRKHLVEDNFSSTVVPWTQTNSGSGGRGRTRRLKTPERGWDKNTAVSSCSISLQLNPRRSEESRWESRRSSLRHAVTSNETS